MSLPVGDSLLMGQSVARFSNGPSECGPWSLARRPMRDEFVEICKFRGGGCCVNYTVGQASRAIYTTTFAISGSATGRHCGGHICVREVLQ